MSGHVSCGELQTKPGFVFTGIQYRNSYNSNLNEQFLSHLHLYINLVYASELSAELFGQNVGKCSNSWQHLYQTLLNFTTETSLAANQRIIKSGEKRSAETHTEQQKVLVSLTVGARHRADQIHCG